MIRAKYYEDLSQQHWLVLPCKERMNPNTPENPRMSLLMNFTTSPLKVWKPCSPK